MIPYHIRFAQFDPAVLVMREGKDPRCAEFRGPPYRAWTGFGWSWAQTLHDSLEGWHACVLHAGDTVTILDRHPDYEAVRALWIAATRAHP